MAMQHIEDILNGPREFHAVASKSQTFIFEKMLPDGRGIQLNMNGTFKGFIDQIRYGRMGMHYIEIILEDIKKQYLNEIIRETFGDADDNIVSSRFFDKLNDKDIEYQDIENFNDFFEVAGTGNLFLKKILLGIEIEAVLIVISCDGELSDITINFGEEQFEKYQNFEMNNKMKMLFLKLCEIQNNYCINSILIGYEPASDDDMKIAEFHCGQVIIYSENSFPSRIAQSCYDTLTQMSLRL